MKKLLIVEDDPSIATLLKYNLEQAGYEVEVEMNGNDGLQRIFDWKPDFIILDLMLPERDGMEICKEVRSQKIQTPIIMLTAKDDEIDKIIGLELGADDYMTKPFSPRELVARIKAVSRRSEQQLVKNGSENDQPTEVIIGPIRVVTDSYELFIHEEQIEITPKEFELLVYLIENKNRVLTRDQLLKAVWQYDFIGDSRIVDVHVSHLRDKIEENTKQPKYIKTVRGIGYKFEEPKTI